MDGPMIENMPAKASGRETMFNHVGEEFERAPSLAAIIRNELEDSRDWGDFSLGRYADAGIPSDGACFYDAQRGL